MDVGIQDMAADSLPSCCYAKRLTGIKCSLGDVEREILIKHIAGVEGSTTLELFRARAGYVTDPSPAAPAGAQLAPPTAV
jgi:hypothetical protein